MDAPVTLDDLDGFDPGPVPGDDGDGDDPERYVCPVDGCDFETLSPIGFRRHMNRQHDGAADPSSAGADSPPPSAPRPRVAEAAPRPAGTRRHPGGLVGRLRDRWSKAKDGTASPRPARTPRPRMSGRVSVADDLSRAYGKVAQRLEYGPHYPTGRIMQTQAPHAGIVFDRALAGSLVDRAVIQPLWRSKDRWEEPFYLVAPPFLTWSIQSMRLRQQALIMEGRTPSDPDIARLEMGIQAQGEMLYWLVEDSFEKMGPAMAEARARKEAKQDAIRQAFPGLDPTEDPVAALISSLFAPPTAPAPAPHQEEQPDVGYADTPA